MRWNWFILYEVFPYFHILYLHCAAPLGRKIAQTRPSHLRPSRAKAKQPVKAEVPASQQTMIETLSPSASDEAKRSLGQLLFLYAKTFNYMPLQRMLDSETCFTLWCHVTSYRQESFSLRYSHAYTLQSYQVRCNKFTINSHCDALTSRATDSYHITVDWSLSSRVFHTRALHESHTGANIAELINKAATGWNITEKNLLCCCLCLAVFLYRPPLDI